MNATASELGRLEWQFFATFTLRRADESDRIKASMFFATLRDQARGLRVHFKTILWALRHELGEVTGRPHFHCLIAGLPRHLACYATCFAFKKVWERHGGGMARVYLYNPLLDGVGYTLKGIEAANLRTGGNWYELRKFGGTCDVMLSESLIEHLAERTRSTGGGYFVARGRDKHAVTHTAKRSRESRLRDIYALLKRTSCSTV